MAPLRKFLIVNDDPRERFYILKTLLRHYPDAIVKECEDFSAAIELVRGLRLADQNTVVIAHRTPQAEGRYLIAALRAAHSSIPIVWTDEPHQSEIAQSAGATRFLDKYAWLLIGKVVEDLV